MALRPGDSSRNSGNLGGGVGSRTGLGNVRCGEIGRGSWAGEGDFAGSSRTAGLMARSGIAGGVDITGGGAGEETDVEGKLGFRFGMIAGADSGVGGGKEGGWLVGGILGGCDGPLFTTGADSGAAGIEAPPGGGRPVIGNDGFLAAGLGLFASSSSRFRLPSSPNIGSSPNARKKSSATYRADALCGTLGPRRSAVMTSTGGNTSAEVEARLVSGGGSKGGCAGCWG